VSSGIYQKNASPCSCGFSTAYPDCNGTHKVVKQLREQIAQEIESIEAENTDATAMKGLAANVARGKSIITSVKTINK
jgi:CDGSH-type Zn-finger protein